MEAGEKPTMKESLISQGVSEGIRNQSHLLGIPSIVSSESIANKGSFVTIAKHLSRDSF